MRCRCCGRVQPCYSQPLSSNSFPCTTATPLACSIPLRARRCTRGSRCQQGKRELYKPPPAKKRKVAEDKGKAQKGKAAKKDKPAKPAKPTNFHIRSRIVPGVGADRIVPTDQGAALQQLSMSNFSLLLTPAIDISIKRKYPQLQVNTAFNF